MWRPRRRRQRPALLAALLLPLLVGFAFRAAPTLPFVSFDDPAYVLDNPQVRGGLTGAGVRWGWTATEQGNWHPLTWWSHMADVSLFGLRPAGHHAVNLGLHLLNALLLFALLRSLTGNLWPSALAAAFFGVHPLQVESVAWVAERKNLLAGLFGMLAAAAHLRATRGREARHRLLVVVLLALGLMAKPVLLTLPFVLLLLDYWPLGRFRSSRPAALLTEKIPLFVLAAAAAVVALNTQRPALVTTADLPLPDRLLGALAGYGWYLGKAAWPSGLGVFYPHPGGDLPRAWPLAAAVALAAATVVAARGVRSRPHLAVGWAWFLGTLVPTIGIVQVGLQFGADRYAYLPLVGLFVMLAWTLKGLAGRDRRTAVAAGVVALAALASLATVTSLQLRHWASSERLFTRARDVTGENWFAEHMLGAVFAGDGRLREAAAAYERSARLNPRMPETWYNLGLLRQRAGRWPDALDAYVRALRLRPEMAVAHNNRGLVLERLGRREEALAAYETAFRLKPDHFEAWSNYGALSIDLGRFREAQRAYGQAARIKAADAQTRFYLGYSAVRAGDRDAALAVHRALLQLDAALAARLARIIRGNGD